MIKITKEFNTNIKIKHQGKNYIKLKEIIKNYKKILNLMILRNIQTKLKMKKIKLAIIAVVLEMIKIIQKIIMI